MDINTLFKQFMQDPEFAAAFNEPLEEEYNETNSQGQILKRGDLSEYKISDEELEEVRNREIVENMQDKKYIVFDHFNPDTLYFVKNIPDDSWIWDSDWIIEDVTDKHGNCLIENNDEYISVGEMGNKTLSDFDKEIIASLKQAIQEDPDEDYLCAYTSEDREFCFEKDELPDDLDSMTPFTDFVENSYVDGDSNSQYQVINLDTEEFGEFGVDIFVDENEDEEELEDEDLDRYTYLIKTSVDDYNEIPGLADHYLMTLNKADAYELDLYIKKANELGYNIREIKGKELYTHPATRDFSLPLIERYRYFVLTPKSLGDILNKYFEDPKFNTIEDDLKVQTDNWTKESGSISGENNYERERIIRGVLQLHNYRTSVMVSEDDKLIIYYNKEEADLQEAMTNKEKLMRKFPELNLNEDTEMGNNKLNKQEVLDWLSEHELAWEDFVNYFEDVYQSSAEVPIDEILGWISDHDNLAEDFEYKFGISVYADDCDDDCDWFEDELEEHVAIDVYDQLNSPNILEIKPSKLKEGILDVFKKKPYLVVDQRHNNKILSKHATKEEAQEAAKNAGGVWRSVYVMTDDELKSREQRLKKEAQKKVTGWGLRDLRDGKFVYTFDTEDEARNHFRKLADSQQMRFSVDPILESTNSSDEKWNIGSNKLVATDSQEFANLVDLAKLLQEKSPNKYQYTVEKTYEDFGAGMQWYNIICYDKKGDHWQVLDTKEWLDLANGNKSVEETYQKVVTDRFFQDTVEKGSIFSILDKFQ